MLGLSEKHIDKKREKIPQLPFITPGYSFIISPRIDGKGGVATCIYESLA